MSWVFKCICISQKEAGKTAIIFQSVHLISEIKIKSKNSKYKAEMLTVSTTVDSGMYLWTQWRNLLAECILEHLNEKNVEGEGKRVYKEIKTEGSWNNIKYENCEFM